METKDIFVQMALKSWNIQIDRANKFLDSLNDEELLKEIAPNRNRVIYLLGHLVAIHDGMISLFGLGERQYAQLDEPFVMHPDNKQATYPSITELRNDWKKNTEALTNYFNNMSSDDWFAKHTSMTDEDLQKDPGRNKLSVLLNRTNHLSYHLGQMALAK